MKCSSRELLRYCGPILGGLSCSLLYSLSSDIYYYCHVLNSKRSGLFKFTYEKAINPGLFFGIMYGSIYTYLGEPILSSLYKRLT